MAASTVLTYFLWLTAGCFGLHHFYLGRDRHAFVWLWTLGGLGVGWLTEIFHLPRYIRESNMEFHLATEAKKIEGSTERSRPPFGIRRFIGELFFAYWIGGLMLAAVPEGINETCYHVLLSLLGPTSVALAIHTVANIGMEQCDLVLCFVFSYAMLPLMLLFPAEHAAGILTNGILVTALAINYNPMSDEDDEEADREVKKFSVSYLRRVWSRRGKRYRRTKPTKHNICWRLAVIFGFSAILLGSLTAAVYFNARIKTDYGEEILVREALENFFKSPAWLRIQDTMWLMVDKLRYGGLSEFLDYLIKSLDPEGELHAYEILKLPQTATEKDINEQYKKLVRQYHPDRFPNIDLEEKKKVEERFIEIQQAYETVSSIKAKRMSKNRRVEL